MKKFGLFFLLLFLFHFTGCGFPKPTLITPEYFASGSVIKFHSTDTAYVAIFKGSFNATNVNNGFIDSTGSGSTAFFVDNIPDGTYSVVAWQDTGGLLPAVIDFGDTYGIISNISINKNTTGLVVTINTTL